MISTQHRLLHVISIVVISFNATSVYARGADVIVHLRGGKVLKGELYRVGDDSLVIKAEAKDTTATNTRVRETAAH